MPVSTSEAVRASRAFDIVVWGASGFTGRLVAEFLARTYGIGRDLRWALGGRNRDKLEKVRADLETVAPSARDLAIVIGDSGDRASLDAVVRQARVVLTTVGPYAIHGAELVAACVAASTDYCDLTGEPQFIRDMIDRHHVRARETGARIVHSCGYDSIPSDLGTLVTQNVMRERHGTSCVAVKCFAGEQKGGISGGTVASMIHVIETASRDAHVRRVLADPYALDPDRGAPGPDGRDQVGVRYDRDLQRWTGLFAMAAINARVVRRTNALLDYAYGRDFRYAEAMSFPRGPKGFFGAASVSLGTLGFFAALSVPPVRRLVMKKLPAPGEGPSKETRDSGFFVTRLVGTAEAVGAPPPPKVFVTVRGTGDPGYAATARMLGESAVCLARDGTAIASGGGVLTPAACMGARLVERLERVGIAFEVTAGAGQ
jgi:short subunit dehydrogenase-like uncharacterized protein